MIGLAAAWLLVWLTAGLLPVAAQGTVTINKVVTTGNDNRTAYNGDIITYTIIMNNNSGNTISNVLILDVLPENVLDNIKCLTVPNGSPCQLISEVQQIPEPLGGTVTVTTTRQISWTIPSMPSGTSLTRSFTARVIGQANSSAFVNLAYARYIERGTPQTKASPELRLIVLQRIEEGGQTSLSETPTWFSQDVGGTLSMDWGDFDRDGDLDLALGSTVATTVYRNNNGKLDLFWTLPQPAYGVRWADVDGDGAPELIAVGAVEGSSGDQNTLAQLPGTNYVYRYDPTTGAANRRFAVLTEFSSTFQMVRVEAGDINGDGAVDLVLSTNAINPDCAVRFFPNDRRGGFSGPGECILRAATAALKLVDFDNDGDLDLVVGAFPNRVQILVNRGGKLRATDSLSIEEGVMFLPYDFAWGDFDGDGDLDLAAAYPLMREVRIYRNLLESGTAGFSRPVSLRTNVFLTPYALDWGDFSGDGRLDLAVADSPPIIYSYTGGFTAASFTPFFVVGDSVVQGQVWAMRAVDQNQDGSLDLTLTDRDGPSLVISNFRPPLHTRLTPILGSTSASSVAWIDADRDDDLDLIFGAGSESPITRLFYNEDGEFPSSSAYGTGFGPLSLAVGDAQGDGDLDVAIGTTSEQRLYLADSFLAPFWSVADAGEKDLAWGDVDGDMDLDLLVASRGADSDHVELFLNDGSGNLGTRPVWQLPIDKVQSVSFGDFDGDGFLDFALGRDGVDLVYRNNRDTTFTVAWTGTVEDNTRAIAWADYDGDGDLDLVTGNFGDPNGAGEVNRLYENRVVDNVRTFVEVSTFGGDRFHTTSLDWGDWDNDGDLDLAVGNYGEADQIYVNARSIPGVPRFFWLWTSAEALNTTGIAWGDRDNDGDLDLAISQDRGRPNGLYINNLVVPSHLPGSGFGAASLINPPVYLFAARPGSTASAYHYSSAELLSGPNQGSVAVDFRIYNPDPTKLITSTANTATTLKLAFEYSIDGGGTWRTATPITTTLTPVTDTFGNGLAGVFLWNALRDQAIGDNARFRIQLVQSDARGPVQRVSAGTISPPFRVRAITCIWPEQPSARPSPVIAPGSDDDPYDFVIPANELVRFTGKVAAGTGALHYTWDFGDSTTAQGQVAEKSFRNGIYQVRMAVSGDPCPQTRERATVMTVKVGTGVPNLLLPRLMVAPPVTDTLPATGTAAGLVTADMETGDMETGQARAAVAPAVVASHGTRPPQVTGLTGDIQFDNGALWLRWTLPTDATVEGLRLYRHGRDEDPATAVRTLVAELAPDATTYLEAAPVCDQVYTLVTVVDEMESLPSAGSYYTAACGDREEMP